MYREKYLKYKIKYINLKKNSEKLGGGNILGPTKTPSPSPNQRPKAPSSPLVKRPKATSSPLVKRPTSSSPSGKKLKSKRSTSPSPSGKKLKSKRSTSPSPSGKKLKSKTSTSPSGKKLKSKTSTSPSPTPSTSPSPTPSTSPSPTPSTSPSPLRTENKVDFAILKAEAAAKRAEEVEKEATLAQKNAEKEEKEALIAKERYEKALAKAKKADLELEKASDSLEREEKEAENAENIARAKSDLVAKATQESIRAKNAAALAKKILADEKYKKLIAKRQEKIRKRLEAEQKEKEESDEIKTLIPKFDATKNSNQFFQLTGTYKKLGIIKLEEIGTVYDIWINLKENKYLYKGTILSFGDDKKDSKDYPYVKVLFNDHKKILDYNVKADNPKLSSKESDKKLKIYLDSPGLCGEISPQIYVKVKAGSRNVSRKDIKSNKLIDALIFKDKNKYSKFKNMVYESED